MNKAILARENLQPSRGLGQNVSFGRFLIERSLIAPWQLFHALDRQLDWDADLVEILCAKGWLSEDQALAALSEFHVADLVDLEHLPPHPDLASLAPADLCLRHNFLPWRRIGGLLYVITGCPDHFERLRQTLPGDLRNAIVGLASQDQVASAIANAHRRTLTELAENRVPSRFSCRGWDRPTITRTMTIAASMAGAAWAFVQAPALVFSALTLCAIFSLTAVSLMKVAAFLVTPRLRAPTRGQEIPTARLPKISVLVPLFREKEITHALVARLSRLTYPKALLDVLLVLEEHDTLTRDTLANTSLPGWMRVITVPAGSGLTTKPRALNYALDFCRGDIIGIWDAEDAPAPNQLEVVAQRFASAPPDTVCLQGVLDYYNPWTNWLSRCFTIEYATWFRTILPGLAKIGFALPLGGTTLFIRRSAILELGGWDAHNVTEDADLGMRIARFGYRTEMLPTVTQEEANCHPYAWVKQRSRWLKGFMVTNLVHIRSPRRLWSDFGPLKFLGLHLVFAFTLIQFLLAPLIWLFWGGVIGLPYPANPILSPEMMVLIAQMFLFFGFMDAVIAIRSILGQGRAALIPFVFTMPLYFPLATLAAYKALFELLFRPYYWDKTSHAKTVEGTNAQFSGVGVLFETGDKSL